MQSTGRDPGCGVGDGGDGALHPPAEVPRHGEGGRDRGEHGRGEGQQQGGSERPFDVQGLYGGVGVTGTGEMLAKQTWSHHGGHHPRGQGAGDEDKCLGDHEPGGEPAAQHSWTIRQVAAPAQGARHGCPVSIR